MKILAVAEFDCAGVLAGHRRVLKALGVDYRIAAKDVYVSDLANFPDWTENSPGDFRVSLEDFARQADVLQFHPAIGQPWSHQNLAPRSDDGEDEDLFGINWKRINLHARRVTLFHGSRNAAAGTNAEDYAAHWRARGHEVWATTLDYAWRMGARLAPPAVDVSQPGEVLASTRGDGDPLVVVHAPTDPDNCHTDVFLSACREAGAVAVLAYRRPHAEVLEMKRRANVGFDHLRGAPSVNTIENLALGLALLCGLRSEYEDLLEREIGGYRNREILLGFSPNEAHLRRRVKMLAGSPVETRASQAAARDWYEACWRPSVIGAKLLKMYEEIVK